MRRAVQAALLAAAGGLLTLVSMLSHSWWSVNGLGTDTSVRVGLHSIVSCLDGRCLTQAVHGTNLGNFATLAPFTFYVGLATSALLFANAALLLIGPRALASLSALACVLVLFLAVLSSLTFSVDDTSMGLGLPTVFAGSVLGFTAALLLRRRSDEVEE